MTTTYGDEMACQALVEIVKEYLDGALPDGVRALFGAYLQECEGCRRYLDQMRTMIRLTGTLTEETLDPGAKKQLLRLFHDWNRT